MAAFAAEKPAKDHSNAVPAGSKVFIDSSDGFDIYLTKALEKKRVPLTVTADKTQADFQVSTTASHANRNTWSDGLAALGGSSNVHSRSVDEAALKVINLKTGTVIYTYQVKKTNSIRGKQSVAEALAKHLNDIIGE